MAKARGTTQPFPWWMLNYFTAYAEGGPDYIHALLTGYEETSRGVPIRMALRSSCPRASTTTTYFPGHAIGMPPPLSDGVVTYAEAEGGVAVPQTVDQYSRDVSAFLMWVAEPHLVARKESGFRVLVFLIVFAGIMYMVKRRIWAKVEH